MPSPNGTLGTVLEARWADGRMSREFRGAPMDRRREAGELAKLMATVNRVRGFLRPSTRSARSGSRQRRTSSTTLPKTRPDSRIRCAVAASASGRTSSMQGRICPASTMAVKAVKSWASDVTQAKP